MEINSAMGRISIIVDYTDNYSACPVNEKIVCISTGTTYKELQKNMEDALHFHIQSMIDDGEAVPEEFSGEWSFDWQLTTRALLHVTEKYVTKAAIAKATGINQQQLTHYASGFRNPRPEMSKRIRSGIHQIALELLQI